MTTTKSVLTYLKKCNSPSKKWAQPFCPVKVPPWLPSWLKASEFPGEVRSV